MSFAAQVSQEVSPGDLIGLFSVITDERSYTAQEIIDRNVVSRYFDLATRAKRQPYTLIRIYHGAPNHL